jgi:hypothetical protein
VPHLGSTPNVPRPKKGLNGGYRTTTLAQAQRIFASGYCTLPGVKPAAAWSRPVDWGKVVRVADAVIVDTRQHHAWAHDARLYEIAGQRRHYVINGYWGYQVNGEVGASPGEVVALCPTDDTTDEALPEGWPEPITRQRVAVRVGGPPDAAGVFPPP